MSDDELKKRRGLKRYQDDLEDADFDDDDSGGSGDAGGTGGAVKPRDLDIFRSSLKQETKAMERERRQLEQRGHRKLGKVNVRERADHTNVADLANQEQKIKQHPLLNNQRYDGVDASLNPAPPDNPEALAEFYNERREQEKEKQLRLGNELVFGKRFDSAPKYTK